MTLVALHLVAGVSDAEAAWSASARSTEAYGGRGISHRGSITTTSRKSKGYKRSAKRGTKSKIYRQTRRKKAYRQVAALPRFYDVAPVQKSLSGGGVRWAANAGCLNGSLKAVIYQVAANYGPVTVSSTCRGKSHNRRVGGAKGSHHLTGNAVDFRVHANAGAAAAFLRSRGGGFKHYGGGLFHIDTGPSRRW
ncbi:MAG: D-Ala-D-Ala carboxypeptidase family metallohydrolase [Hyphomicrobiaceae bacterium]|nr:D-Ala-D-Ala carboxypeptidase family metallohydrolase [Hyphomicrobiaceae bacterium]